MAKPIQYCKVKKNKNNKKIKKKKKQLGKADEKANERANFTCAALGLREVEIKLMERGSNLFLILQFLLAFP